jgi:hypothetical protein
MRTADTTIIKMAISNILITLNTALAYPLSAFDFPITLACIVPASKIRGCFLGYACTRYS